MSTEADQERERSAAEPPGVYGVPPPTERATTTKTISQEAAWPRVAVIVLNYNGRSYLDACLSALARTKYPAESLEVVVVDNASKDGSVDDLAGRFPSVRLLRLDRNLGFAEGNNVGISSTTAPYVVLLNNDTAVEPGWLEPLVRVAEGDPTIGGCGPKLLFLYGSLHLALDVGGAFVPARELAGSSDERMLGVPLAAVTLDPASPGASVRFSGGWYPREVGDKGPFRWSSERASLFLPVGDDGRPLQATLRFLGRPPGLPPAEVQMHVDAQLVGTTRVESAPVSCRVMIPAETLARAERRIQNAGQELLPGAYCRDRGSWMSEGEEQHALDGSYEQQEEVFALCGAAVLLRRRMLDEVGVLDPRFFMYYEDVDLCWRARRAGWRMVYVPESVVRHVHAGSSGEWSPFFRFHAERNRLFLLVKNAPRDLLWQEIAKYLSQTASLGKDALRAMARGRAAVASLAPELRHRVAVVRSLVGSLPHLLRGRRNSHRRARISSREILAWMVR